VVCQRNWAEFGRGHHCAAGFTENLGLFEVPIHVEEDEHQEGPCRVCQGHVLQAQNELASGYFKRTSKAKLKRRITNAQRSACSQPGS
jgi:hypothetical protein